MQTRLLIVLLALLALSQAYRPYYGYRRCSDVLHEIYDRN